MKKVLLTAALGCAFITSSFAANPPTQLTDNLQTVVIDYISMSPSGGPFPPDLLQKTFNQNNSFDMNAPFVIPATPFTVTASRSWHVTYDATDFTRSGPAPDPMSNITTIVPVGEIFSVLAAGTSSNVTNVHAGFYPAQITSDKIITGKGGAGNTFTISSQIDLSNAVSDFNLQGAYTTSVNVIATLD